MATASWKGVTLAESDETVMVEGNHYFPPSSVKKEYFSDNAKTSACPWKGLASYYDVTVDGETASATAWYYPDPKDAASEIRDHVAFWGDVTVTS